MAPDELLAVARDSRERYLTHYLTAIQREREVHDQVAAELLIEVGGPAEGILRRLWRIDVVWGGASEPHLVEVNDGPVEITTPLARVQGPPVLEVFPFVWNACELIWPSSVQLGEEFEAWYTKWMDLEEAKPGDVAGLSGVVHSVTTPGPLSGGWGISVDFGSAPVDALSELMQLQAVRTAASLRIGSFGFVEQ